MMVLLAQGASKPTIAIAMVIVTVVMVAIIMAAGHRQRRLQDFSSENHETGFDEETQED